MPRIIRVSPRQHLARFSIGAIATLHFAGTPAFAQSIPLTGDELLSGVETVSKFVPKDQFETPPKGPAWAGRRFTYSLIPKERRQGESGCEAYPYWIYVASTLVVIAGGGHLDRSSFTGPGSIGVGEIDSYSVDELHAVSCFQLPVTTMTASNAFGVKFSVEKWDETVVGVLDTSRYEPKWPGQWNNPIAGDAARELTKNLRIRVSGTLQEWPGGATVICGVNRQTPKVTSPKDKTIEACLYRGRVDTIEVLDASSNRVLYLAKRKSAQ